MQSIGGDFLSTVNDLEYFIGAYLNEEKTEEVQSGEPAKESFRVIKILLRGKTHD